ncbi:putative copia-type polyprotein [Trifolium pratense]|uniref:Putative copia-type polyprotein n=1 Tax=Trifolium pratense TaxID=57577 RepID=A0A2K3LKP0_TRIPR|nr:putative copia-type polyprotein [Trifolium pratense]
MIEEVSEAQVNQPVLEVRRSNRPRVLLARLQECEMNSDNQGTIMRCAMKEELDSIENNQTWELVDLPQRKKAIDVKWVYKLKVNSKGEITIYKARLVAKGFLQKEGIDYDEVFAPVTRMETIRLPPGYEVKGQEFKVYKLKNALYGLKQAPRAWNKRIDKFLNEIGFVKCITEHGVYVKKDAAKGLIVICLYVDDLLITGSNESYISEFKSDLRKGFEMTDLGHMTYFLGIEFLRNEQGILMHQTRYASEILKRFEMDKCNVALSPAEPRPDLAYSVGIVSRFMERPKHSHLIADRKSTAGYIFFYGGAPISWCSKKEPVVALSSCEAEYIAASLSTCQAIWLKNLIEEISQDKCETVTLKIDNVFAINLAKNPIAHVRSKHIELRFHYLRKQVNNGNLALIHCRSEEQVADLLTKAMTVQVFEKLRSVMGIEIVDNMN